MISRTFINEFKQWGHGLNNYGGVNVLDMMDKKGWLVYSYMNMCGTIINELK